MENVKMEVKGNILTITVDLTKDFGPSGTGKTNRVASSLGYKQVPGKENISINLNVSKKK